MRSPPSGWASWLSGKRMYELGSCQHACWHSATWFPCETFPLCDLSVFDYGLPNFQSILDVSGLCCHAILLTIECFSFTSKLSQIDAEPSSPFLAFSLLYDGTCGCHWILSKLAWSEIRGRWATTYWTCWVFTEDSSSACILWPAEKTLSVQTAIGSAWIGLSLWQLTYISLSFACHYHRNLNHQNLCLLWISCSVLTRIRPNDIQSDSLSGLAVLLFVLFAVMIKRSALSAQRSSLMKTN